MTGERRCLGLTGRGEKAAFETVPEIAAAIARVETRVAGKGRLLIRYSGTPVGKSLALPLRGQKGQFFFADRLGLHERHDRAEPFRSRSACIDLTLLFNRHGSA